MRIVKLTLHQVKTLCFPKSKWHLKLARRGARGGLRWYWQLHDRAWSYCFHFPFSTCSKQRKCHRTTHLTTVGLSLSWRGFKVTMCHQLSGREERHIRRRQGLLLLDYWTLMMQPAPARGPRRCGQWNAGSGTRRPMSMQGGSTREGWGEERPRQNRWRHGEEAH